jgi:hypothetical protein
MPINPCKTLFLWSLSLLLGAATTAQVVLRFDNQFNGRKVILDSPSYNPGYRAPFTISRLQYYISNIVFTRTNGQQHIVPRANSFFLVRQSSDSSRNIVLNIPDGVYSSVSFLVGIDSLTSTLPIEQRKGVLDPGMDMAAGEGMYWTWNSGYIFFKMEGSSPAIPADKTGFREFEYHIGGYGGFNSPTINNIRRIAFDLPATGPLRVRSHQQAIVHIRFEASHVFDQLDLNKHHHIMLTPISTQIANNYAVAFTYGGTEYTK